MLKKSLTVCFLILCLFFVGWINQKRTTWEYKTEDLIDSPFSDEKLNTLGAQGWELVDARASQRNSGFMTCTFKRMK